MTEKNKRKLLVLGAVVQLNEIVQQAKEAGYYVIVADYFADSPAKKYADESWLVSITDVPALIKCCIEEQVDGIMNYCIDPGQKPYQEICEKLGFPCVGTKEQFDILTNKDVFKRTCQRYGIVVIPGFEADEFTADERLSNIEYPVIVKPVDGRASKGLSKCSNERELKKGIKFALENSMRGKCMVEKYLERKEVCAKYVACDGEIFLTSLSDVYDCVLEDGTRVYMGTSTYPSRYYYEFMKETNQKLIGMLKSIGVKNGATSFTGFYDDGIFRFFDPSFRMGGAQDWRISAYITGIDISKLLTNFAMTGNMGNWIR